MKNEIVKLFKRAGINIEHRHLSFPPDSKLGDISCTIAFEVAKKKKKNPKDVASEIAMKLKPSGIISHIKVVGPYINLFLEKNKFSKRVLDDSVKKNFGAGTRKKDNVMIEFSQPNTHKPFHVGHIRGTSLGESLSRIFEFQGFPVARANYSGDTGMHIAKCLWCYLKFHKGREPKENRGLWLGEIYAEANRKLEENEKYMEEIKDLNRKIEQGEDKELMKLWKNTRQWSIDEFNEIFKEMGTRFDRWFFEREVESRGKELALRLLKKKIAKRSDGAVIVDLKKYGLGVFVLLRADDTVLYSAKDLALAEMKFKEFKIDRSVYVVGSEQKFYFRQLFKTLELMGFKQVKKCHHLVFDLVLLPTGKMSSRKGTALNYIDFRDKMFDLALKESKKRNKNLRKKEIDNIAMKIAIAAMKFSMMRVESTKRIIFDMKKAVSFEGDSAPYIQYSAVRAKHIIENSKKKSSFEKIVEDCEFSLIKKIENFPDIVRESADKYAVHILANYSIELAQLFNELYSKCKVVGSEYEPSRLAIVKSYLTVISKCLELLGIEIPERM